MPAQIDPRSLAAKVQAGEIDASEIDGLSRKEKIELGIALRAANLLRGRQTQGKVNPSAIRADERKRRLISALERHIKDSKNEDSGLRYPDIVNMGLRLGIPAGTLGRYLWEDKELRAKLDELERLMLQDCKRTVYDARHKQPYLALQLLQTRDPDFAPKQIVSGSVAHYHVISHVRSEQITPAQIQDAVEITDPATVPNEAR